jgi:hypothetical protein
VPENVVPYNQPHTVKDVNDYNTKTKNLQDIEIKQAIKQLLEQRRNYKKDD